jgi:hypothetical protein
MSNFFVIEWQQLLQCAAGAARGKRAGLPAAAAQVGGCHITCYFYVVTSAASATGVWVCCLSSARATSWTSGRWCTGEFENVLCLAVIYHVRLAAAVCCWRSVRGNDLEEKTYWNIGLKKLGFVLYLVSSSSSLPENQCSAVQGQFCVHLADLEQP